MNDSTTNIPNEIQTTEDNIVFFDGVCGMCNHTVNFLIARDHTRRLRFAPLQGPTSERLVDVKVREELDTFVFLSDERQFYRSAALARILMTIGGLWWLVGVLYWLIPLPLRDLAYRFVAANRYRVMGKHDTCRIPTSEERALFLD